MKDLTLVIPAKREKESLPKVLSELENHNLKKIIVLEKNDIQTINSIQSFDCRIIYQKNKGYGDALIQGINSVNTKYFCIFNADGSFDPKELSKMYEKSNIEEYDLVFGSRYGKNSGSDDDTIVTYVGNKIFTFLGKLLFGLPITDILYTYVLGKTAKINSLRLYKKDFCFCVEMPIKAKKNNFKLTSINSYERSRIAGKKKVNALKDGLLILICMLNLIFSKK